MKIVHLLAGLGAASGVANMARRFARAQSERGDVPVLLAPAFKWNPIYFGLAFAVRALRQAVSAKEVWVHCSWTFPVWYGALLAKVFGKRLVVVPSGSFDPKRLGNHAGWKKRLVAPLDRWVLRQADEVLALCKDEIGWVEGFEPSARVRVERVPIFFKEGELKREVKVRGEGEQRSDSLHVLFLGRAEDPLKGVRFLEQAVEQLQSEQSNNPNNRTIELRIVSDHFGEELEKDWAWCDVLCLPTLSENFGLVVAEALERGKRVVVTDGAPAWEPGESKKEEGKVKKCGRLIYLRGYREGTDEERVRLLKEAIEAVKRVEKGLRGLRGCETRGYAVAGI